MIINIKIFNHVSSRLINMNYQVCKLGVINIIIGFLLIFIASSGGFFIAKWQKDIIINQNPMELLDWWGLLAKSSHGHTNLFGMFHILFGLTLNLSAHHHHLKVFQSIAILFGSIAMSLLLFIRAYHTPSSISDPLAITIGSCLSFFLLAILLHILGVVFKLTKINTLQKTSLIKKLTQKNTDYLD